MGRMRVSGIWWISPRGALRIIKPIREAPPVTVEGARRAVDLSLFRRQSIFKLKNVRILAACTRCGTTRNKRDSSRRCFYRAHDIPGNATRFRSHTRDEERRRYPIRNWKRSMSFTDSEIKARVRAALQNYITRSPLPLPPGWSVNPRQLCFQLNILNVSRLIYNMFD